MSLTSHLDPVLVTGATGNVGRAVVEELSRRSIPFAATGRRPSQVLEVLGDVDARRLDFDDPSTFEEALRGMRGLFLLRPPPVANVKETLNTLVALAVSMGVEHVTFLSVMGADRQRFIPHYQVERHLEQARVSTTLLRAGFFAQNLGNAYRDDIRHRSEIVVPAGRGRAAFVDVRDIAELAARSFIEPELRDQAWVLTGPEAVSFHEVAAALSEVLGRPVRYRRVGVLRYLRHLRRSRLPWAQILVQTVLHLGLRFGNAEQVDPTLTTLLGRRARTIRNYVRDHAELWRSE